MKPNISPSSPGTLFSWRLAGYAAGLSALIALYFSKLVSLTPASQAEEQLLHSVNGQGVGADAILAPFRLLSWLLNMLPISQLAALRTAGAVTAIATVIFLFIAIRRWHGTGIAVSASALFASSSWMLTTGRNGAGLATLSLGVAALLSSLAYVGKTKPGQSADLAFIALSVAITVSLVMPGGIWFLVVAGIVSHQQVRKHITITGMAAKVIGSCLILAGAAAFVLAFVQGEGTLREALGIPLSLPEPVTALKQLIFSISAFAVRGPEVASLWLGHTPLLDIATSIMCLMGAVLYGKHLHNARTRLLLGFVATAIALTALNGYLGLSYLIPIVYMLAASGMAYFYHQWHKVFPKNPVATTVAVVVLGFVGLSVITFHTQRYFVAWPNAPQTITSTMSSPDDSIPDAR